MINRRSHPVLAPDAWRFLLPLCFGTAVAFYFKYPNIAWSGVALIVVIIIWMRDPRRDLVAMPLGVVSPVDGKIISVAHTDKTRLDREAILVVIRVAHSGTYSVYSPAEGCMRNISETKTGLRRLLQHGGMWVRTDEEDDVVLVLKCFKWLWQPKSLVRYGERIGQGQRCALIRMAHFAEVYLPLNAHVMVAPGQRVKAGSDPIAELMHHR